MKSIRSFSITFQAILFSFLLLLFCNTAPTQTIDCSGSSKSGNYQVYLDDLSYANVSLSNDGQLQNLMKRLSFKLASNVHALTLESTPIPLTVAYCEGRKPRGEGDFSENLVDALDDNNVILELWGQLDATTQNGSISNRKASICYVLVPVLLDEFKNPHKPGLQFALYPKDANIQSGELINLLEESIELEAFVAVGIGVNLLKNKKYDEAMKYLCKAQIILRQQHTGIAEVKQNALNDYIKQAVHKTVIDARSDPNYTGSLIDLVDENNPCP